VALRDARRAGPIAAERILGAPAVSIDSVDEEALRMPKGRDRAPAQQGAAQGAQTTLWPVLERKAEG